MRNKHPAKDNYYNVDHDKETRIIREFLDLDGHFSTQLWYYCHWKKVNERAVICEALQDYLVKKDIIKMVKGNRVWVEYEERKIKLKS